MEVLLRCSVMTLQPMEVFPLFPEVTAPWAHLQPTKHYWHLHRPLAELRAMVTRRLQPAAGNGLAPEASLDVIITDAQEQVATYLLQARLSKAVTGGSGLRNFGNACLCRFVRWRDFGTTKALAKICANLDLQ